MTAAAAESASSAPELVIFTKSHGDPLTKRISLGSDGSVISDGSQCVMPSGAARRFRFSTMQAVSEQIAALQQNEAIATGALRHGLPERVEVITKSKLNGADHPGIIARTHDYIVYRSGQPALVLVDFDTKGMPVAFADRMAEPGGFCPTLASVMPALRNAARVERASTSAGLFDSRNGQPYQGSGGVHVYILIADGADAERFLKTLHERCWLAGLGWMIVGAGGQLLERSIVDRVCGTPERLAFEGRPVVVPPLAQDLAVRIPAAIEGEAIDTKEACPPLNIVDLAKLRDLRAKEAHRLVGESARVRGVFVDRQARRLAERAGIDPRQARKIVERQCNGVLLPDIELPFDDDSQAGITVSEVLADPVRFEGETLADPLEGVEYGRCKACIMRRADGSVWINSFAHGRTTYELKLDFPAAKAGLRKVGKEEAADALVQFALGADLDDDEVEELRNIASEKTGINKRTLDRKIKSAPRSGSAARTA
jgi:hypothetical protein